MNIETSSSSPKPVGLEQESLDKVLDAGPATPSGLLPDLLTGSESQPSTPRYTMPRSQSDTVSTFIPQSSSRLIDVDVVKRRKTLKLDKTHHQHSRARKQMMVMRVLFFPFYYSFWKRWMQQWQLHSLCALYIMYVYCTAIYSVTPRIPGSQVLTNFEIFTPYAFLVIVAIVMGRIAVTLPRTYFEDPQGAATESRDAASSESGEAASSESFEAASTNSEAALENGSGEGKGESVRNPDAKGLFRSATTGHGEASTTSVARGSARSLPQQVQPAYRPPSPRARMRMKSLNAQARSNQTRKTMFKSGKAPRANAKVTQTSLPFGDESGTEDSYSSSDSDEFDPQEDTPSGFSKKSHRKQRGFTPAVRRKSYRTQKSFDSKTPKDTGGPGEEKAEASFPKLNVRFPNKLRVDTKQQPASLQEESTGALGKETVQDEARLPSNAVAADNTSVGSSNSASPKQEVEELVRAVFWDNIGQLEIKYMHVMEIRHAIEDRVRSTKRSSMFYSKFASAVALVTGLLAVVYRACMFSQPYFCLLLYSMQNVTHIRSVPGLHLLVSPFVVGKLCGNACATQEDGCFQELISKDFDALDVLSGFVLHIMGTTLTSWVTVATAALANGVLAYALSCCILMAEEVFRKRLLYAKYYSKLTSSSKARKYNLPHFRLNRVEHIKAWLNLRTRRMDTEKEGLHRGADSVAYMVAFSSMFLILVLALKTFALLSGDGKKSKNKMTCAPLSMEQPDPFATTDLLSNPDWQDEHGYLGDWMLLLWTASMSIYMSRFMNLTSKTNKKYKNTPLILTEQINLYIKVLRKKHLKEELMACNSMLGLAMKLIAELEEGGDKKNQKHKELVNPQVYNLLRVCLLSALGTMSSEYLGFKVRLWKL